MNTVEILKAARAKITNPENWTQGWFAKNEHGDRLLGVSPAATCYCSLGAVEAVTGVEYAEDGWPWDVSRALSVAMGGNSNFGIASYNDNHTHEDVLAAFDRAIASTEAEGA